jgi:hypothetical protein
LEEVQKTESQVESDAVELQERYREEIQWMRLKLLKLKERFYEGFFNRSKVPERRIVQAPESFNKTFRVTFSYD